MSKYIESKTTYISTATTTHVVAATNTNVFIHTIVCPIATTGTVTFQDLGTPTTYFVLPVGSIGTFIMDATFGNGLDVVTSQADKVIINWQQ